MNTTRDIFCANCQITTPHTGVVDQNGEFLFTCTIDGCGRFMKLPADFAADQFEAYFVKHEEANIGQVSIEAQEKTLEQVMGDAPQDQPTDDQPAESGDQQVPAA